MRSVTTPTRQPGLPARTVRGGAHVVLRVSRRTIDVTEPGEGSRLQRIGLLLLLVPALVIVLALGAIVFAVLLIVAAIVAAALGVATLVFRQRLERGR